MAVKNTRRTSSVYIPIDVVEEPGKPGRYDVQIVGVLDKPKSIGVQWKTPVGPAHTWFTKGQEVSTRLLGELLACLMTPSELKPFTRGGKVNVLKALAHAVAENKVVSAYVDYDEYNGRKYRRARLFRKVGE